MLYYVSMALSIKSIETEDLARKVAAQTGESLTGAIQKSLEERLERLNTNRRSHILERVDARPDLDARTPDEILGYDEDGLPR
jgi:antitoxin VapB